MTRYAADPARILDLVDRARSVGQDIDRRLADVTFAVDTLHLEWDGDAAEAHRAAHERWSREVREMSAALTQLESTVRGARDRYVANTAHNVGMWP